MNVKKFLLTGLLSISFGLLPAVTDEIITIEIDPSLATHKIPKDYVELSYEANFLLPDGNRNYYFDPDNRKLVYLFRTLGLRSLRIGGNSLDVFTVPIPEEQGIERLFEFAQKAHTKVIYSVRLQDGSPESAMRIAKFINTYYANQLDYFAIGNEPDYYKDYENDLRPRWLSIYKAMHSVAPKAKFCGIDANFYKYQYSKFLKDFAKPTGPVSLITLHNYSSGCAYNNPGVKDIRKLDFKDAKEGRALLLSNKTIEADSITYDKMKDILSQFPYRLSETNNIGYGGLSGASDTFASALWCINYMYWWASHHSQGVNFHSGDMVGGGKKYVPSRYAAFVKDGKGFNVRPMSYALKLFDLGSHGKMIPLKTPDVCPFFTAFATRQFQTITVTLINRSYGERAIGKQIKLTLADNRSMRSKAKYMIMEAPNGDVSARQGIQLGKDSIQSDGTWMGRWSSIKTKADTLTIDVPAASAVVVKINRR